MAGNEDLDPTPPQDILNLFAVAKLLSRSSSDSDKYKCAWLKAKLIRYFILSTGEFTDACSRALYISPNMPMQLPIINRIKNIFQYNISR